MACCGNYLQASKSSSGSGRSSKSNSSSTLPSAVQVSPSGKDFHYGHYYGSGSHGWHTYYRNGYHGHGGYWGRGHGWRRSISS